jgi:hypothetical protein
VSAPTAHLSLFQLMAVEPSASVESAKAYPNPFLPARGHAELKFAGLPLGAKVTLYTILGEKVRELAADGSGTARWDGRTEAGHAAATGVYVALIESGGERTTLKVAVQR